MAVSALRPPTRVWSRYLKEDTLRPLEPRVSTGELREPALCLLWQRGNWGKTLRTLSKWQEGPKSSSCPFPRGPLKKSSRNGTRESGLELASWTPVMPFTEAFPPTKTPRAQERNQARVPAARPLTRRQERPGVLPQAAGVVPPCAPRSPAPLTAYSPDPRPGHNTE